MSEEVKDDRIRMGDTFSPRGLEAKTGNIYTVMGLPKPRGQYISVARDANGAVLSFPEDLFREAFYRINPDL